MVRTSVAASSQHTDPQEDSARRLSRWVTSSDPGTKGAGSGNVRRTLNYSTIAGSHADNSDRIISELHREVDDLRREAQDWSLAKERPRNRVNLSKRKGPKYLSPSSPLMEVWVESFSPQHKPVSSALRPSFHRSSKRRGRSHPRPFHLEKSPQKRKLSTRRIVRTEE